jgi:hypothetical protein
MTATTTTAASDQAAFDFRVAALELASFGRKEIRLAEHEMPGLMALRAEYGLPGPAAPRSVDLSVDLAGHLATLQQAVDAWRSLAEERAREIGDLRTRLAARELELIDERRARLRAEQLAGGEGRATRPSESPRRPTERSTGQNSWLARVFSGDGDERDAGR